MDCGRTDRRLACGPSHEGWWLRRPGRHYSWRLGRGSRRMDFWHAWNLAWRGNDWIDHCCFRRSSYTRVDYPLVQESLTRPPAAIVRAAWGIWTRFNVRL